MLRALFPVIYIIIGVVISINNGYFALGSISQILSFLLAVLLWPLIFIGANLHLNLGF
jgi:hypothetical protein